MLEFAKRLKGIIKVRPFRGPRRTRTGKPPRCESGPSRSKKMVVTAPDCNQPSHDESKHKETELAWLKNPLHKGRYREGIDLRPREGQREEKAGIFAQKKKKGGQCASI